MASAAKRLVLRTCVLDRQASALDGWPCQRALRGLVSTALPCFGADFDVHTRSSRSLGLQIDILRNSSRASFGAPVAPPINS
eukprot:12309495-Alexandrium_andersonii.AAC.1